LDLAKYPASLRALKLNVIMKIKNVISSLLVIVTLGVSGLNAQNTQMPPQQKQIEVSQSELTQFAEVFQKMRMLNQEAQKEMMEVIKDEGFELQRFNEIHQASMDPNKEVELSDAEDAKYKAAVKELESMQPEFQKEMQDLIADSDLSMERYQKIAMALRADAELQKRLQEVLKS